MAKSSPQFPYIMKSTLSRKPRWFVVTKYEYRQGIDVTPNRGDGKRHEYMVAKEKFDVTTQMLAILRHECKPRRPRREYVTKQRRIEIMSAARAYVAMQLRTMAKFGAAPKLTKKEHEALVLECATPAFEIEKWRVRNELASKGQKT